MLSLYKDIQLYRHQKITRINLEEYKSVFVTKCRQIGFTTLGVLYAIQKANEGKSVLFLCINGDMVRHIKGMFKNENHNPIKIQTLKQALNDKIVVDVVIWDELNFMDSHDVASLWMNLKLHIKENFGYSSVHSCAKNHEIMGFTKEYTIPYNKTRLFDNKIKQIKQYMTETEFEREFECKSL